VKNVIPSFIIQTHYSKKQKAKKAHSTNARRTLLAGV
jgi:hypothetical protein